MEEIALSQCGNRLAVLFHEVGIEAGAEAEVIRHDDGLVTLYEPDQFYIVIGAADKHEALSAGDPVNTALDLSNQVSEQTIECLAWDRGAGQDDIQGIGTGNGYICGAAQGIKAGQKQASLIVGVDGSMDLLIGNGNFEMIFNGGLQALSFFDEPF
jgi:hypothetical protein